MTELFYIKLLLALGSSALYNEIFSYFETAEKIFSSKDSERRFSGLFTYRQLEKLNMDYNKKSLEIINICKNNNWKIITPESEFYPKRLLNILNYPPVIFVDGDERELNRSEIISIVGTRKATGYSINLTKALSYSLAKSGMSIVSGAALGIDSAAHKGAIFANGKTVAVLGCGFGTRYLMENSELRRDISQNGAVISEFPPFATASKYTFPLRNRIISGISLGTVVIEAGEKSGSLITARLAAEQGRDVFAIPGDVITSRFTGTNKLIRDGAKPVFTPYDVLSEYEEEYKNIDTKNTDLSFGEIISSLKSSDKEKSNECKTVNPVTLKQNKRTLPENLPETVIKVYNTLSFKPQIVDLISEKAELSISETLSALTTLEILDFCEQCAGSKYICK